MEVNSTSSSSSDDSEQENTQGKQIKINKTSKPEHNHHIVSSSSSSDNSGDEQQKTTQGSLDTPGKNVMNQTAANMTLSNIRFSPLTTPLVKAARGESSSDSESDSSGGESVGRVSVSPSPIKEKPTSPKKKLKADVKQLFPKKDTFRFQCPADFHRVDTSESSIYKEDLENKEIWLIKAPHDFDVELLESVNPKNMTETLGPGQGDDKTVWGAKTIKSKRKSVNDLSVVLPSKSDEVPVYGGKIHGEVHISKCFETAPYMMPEMGTKIPPSIPSGLKLRYVPFGAGSPLCNTQQSKTTTMTMDSFVETKQQQFTSSNSKKKKKSKDIDKNMNIETSINVNSDSNVSPNKDEQITEIVEDKTQIKKHKKKKRQHSDLHQVEPETCDVVSSAKKKKKEIICNSMVSPVKDEPVTESFEYQAQTKEHKKKRLHNATEQEELQIEEVSLAKKKKKKKSKQKEAAA